MHEVLCAALHKYWSNWTTNEYKITIASLFAAEGAPPYCVCTSIHYAAFTMKYF